MFSRRSVIRLKLAVAVDAEFQKTRGRIFARSVALVPFILSSAPSTVKQDLSALRPVVLSLDPTAVIESCDVLPCGHVIKEVIERMSAPFLAADLPADRALGKQLLQLDPYSIPNPRKFASILATSLNSGPYDESQTHSDKSWAELRALLGPYMGGSALSPYSKPFCLPFTDFLFHVRQRKRFSSLPRNDDVGNFICESSDEPPVEKIAKSFDVSQFLQEAITAVASSLRKVDEGDLSPSSAAEFFVNVERHRFETLEDLAGKLAEIWNNFLAIAPSQNMKTAFFSYSDSDQDVIRTTMELLPAFKGTDSVSGWSRRNPPRSVPRRKSTESASSLDRFPFLPSGVRDIRIIDITKHFAFRNDDSMAHALSFARTPGLVKYISTVAEQEPLGRIGRFLGADPASKKGLQLNNHDPLWDAMALSLIVRRLDDKNSLGDASDVQFCRSEMC